MITRFIGLKEFRTHLTRVARRAHTHRERYIVLRKNEAIFELRPLSKKDATLERLQKDLKKAEADVRAGRLYTQEDVERLLHL